jgi:hypothetical protein
MNPMTLEDKRMYWMVQDDVDDEMDVYDDEYECDDDEVHTLQQVMMVMLTCFDRKYYQDEN